MGTAASDLGNPCPLELSDWRPRWSRGKVTEAQLSAAVCACELEASICGDTSGMVGASGNEYDGGGRGCKVACSASNTLGGQEDIAVDGGQSRALTGVIASAAPYGSLGVA